MPTARQLDLLGARAWPLLEEVALDGWRLRFAGGVTRRANSVLPLGPEGDPPPAAAELGRRVAAVEGAYAERGLRPRFQLTASSWPAGLAGELAARGYGESDRTLVLTAAVAPAPAPRAELRVHAEPPASWFEVWWRVDGRGGPAEAAVARGILHRIEPPCAFVECRDGDGVTAVGLGVLDGCWLGVSCMATAPRARRRGYGSAVLACLLAVAADRGAVHAQLSVTEANAPARALYRGFGFDERQSYSSFTA